MSKETSEWAQSASQMSPRLTKWAQSKAPVRRHKNTG
jgi:hypothetical protein